MAERRSLTNAIAATNNNEINPDLIRSFVKQEPANERPVPAPVDLPVSPETTRPSAGRTYAIPKKKPGRLEPIGLIPVTVRLRPEIAGALKRASLQRELEGQDIFTQQALVEQLLEPWLHGEGYL